MIERPLYRTIAESIEARITVGEFPTDEPLPAEPLLEKEFGVSRITIRRALAQLKQKGLLYSRSGKGTLVRAGVLNTKSMRVTGSISDLSYYAAETIYTPMGHRTLSASSEVATRLAIPIGDEVLYMSGARGSTERELFAFEEIFVPAAFSPNVTNFNLSGRTVFSLIEEIHGVSIEEVRQVVTAVMPSSEVRSVLGMPKQQCCLKAERLYIGRGDRLMELSITHYNSTKFAYTTVLYAD